MILALRASRSATTVLLVATALAACGSSGPAATAQSTTSVVASGAPSAAPTVLVTAAATPAPTAASTVAPSPTAQSSSTGSQAPVTTIVPGSSLDPSLSDAGVAGRITIVFDSRDDRTGTHEILGLAADGSNCSYSLDGNEFTAVAWFDNAPNGMLHQMAVTVPSDEMPANDGEQRSGISDGRVYADFVSESGFGTAYSGDASEPNSGSVTIDIVRTGETVVFSYAGLTWDSIEFSGQMICASVTE